MADSAQSTTWADTAATLLSKLSGGVELAFTFDQMELQMPNLQNPAAAGSTWRLNGSVRIRTKGDQPAAGSLPGTPRTDISG